MATFRPSVHVNFGRKSKARIEDEDDTPIVVPKAKATQKAVGKKERPTPEADKAKRKREKEKTLALPPPSKPQSTDEDPDPTDDEVYGTDDDQSDDNEGDSNEKDTAVMALPGVDRRTLRRLNTMFGQRSTTIVSLLEGEDQDSASQLISRTLLQTLVDILPVLERNVRRSKGARGVYQLNQVISQIREMCSDIQANKDRANVGAMTVERFIRPAFLDIAVQLTTAFVEIEEQARLKMNKEDLAEYKANTLLPLKKGLAEYITRQYGEIQTAIVKSFG